MANEAKTIVLICPPFAGIERPSLGLHILQSIARRSGLQAEVFYANLSLARRLGESRYVAVAYSPPLELLGELVFAQFAFPSIRRTPNESVDEDGQGTRFLRASQERQTLPTVELELLRSQVGDWLDEFRLWVRASTYQVYAFSTMFAQNNATIAMARIVREEHPNSIIVLGGANCDGPMALGIAEACTAADHVFQGESEDSFEEFCRSLLVGRRPSARVVAGRPFDRLSDTECPQYDEYFEQFRAHLPDSELMRTRQIYLPYETSRGCWWGQKSHCTFCGLNANGMQFRTKQPSRALADLRELVGRYGRFRIAMTDNIMPLSYFDDVLPVLADSEETWDIFYEQKANLKPDQVALLKRAGVNTIQPGIESLSSSLLRRMGKGVSANQNLRLLRDCRTHGVDVTWNLLYGFPGETAEEYVELTKLLPYLVHLSPPNGLSKVSFDRFSPYFDRAAEFRIENLTPHPNYYKVYPESLQVNSLAYHFVGDCSTVDLLAPELLAEIREKVNHWIRLWRGDARPVLTVTALEASAYLVVDSRRSDAPCVEVVPEEMARLVTSGGTGWSTPDPLLTEALERGWVAVVDARVVGLATWTASARQPRPAWQEVGEGANRSLPVVTARPCGERQLLLPVDDNYFCRS